MEPRTETEEAETDDKTDSEAILQETPNATEPQAIDEPPRVNTKRSTRTRRIAQWHQI